MINKPRDKKTRRYIPWTGTEFDIKKKLFVTRGELIDAYIAGLNDQSGIMRPSKKAQIYLKNKGFL